MAGTFYISEATLADEQPAVDCQPAAILAVSLFTIVVFKIIEETTIMGRRKKSSATLDKAEKRLAGLKSIAPKLDLGHGMSTDWYEKEVTKLRKAIENYNTLLSTVDDAANEIEALEKQVSAASENVLMSVKIKFGKDSSQYEMAGGTRLSDRRRRRDSAVSAEAALA